MLPRNGENRPGQTGPHSSYRPSFYFAVIYLRSRAEVNLRDPRLRRPDTDVTHIWKFARRGARFVTRVGCVVRGAHCAEGVVVVVNRQPRTAQRRDETARRGPQAQTSRQGPKGWPGSQALTPSAETVRHLRLSAH